MRNSLIKTLCLLLSVCTFFFCVSCVDNQTNSSTDFSSDVKEDGNDLPLTVEYGIADQSNLYGICYHMEGNIYWNSPFTKDEIPIEVQLIANLGAKTVRHWMHCTTLMTDKNTMNKEQCELLHTALSECEKQGIVNIGMNHHNFNNGVSSIGKLARNLTKGSEYIRWLNDYYVTWFNLVKEFPEVTYWEIDNELNNPDFMFNAYDKSKFTSEQMANIATDMLYYASRGIHDANPDAKTVMGGLTETMGLGYGDASLGKPTNVWFLQRVYDNIHSGEFGYFYDTESDNTASINPDDYFEIFNYHPYVWSLKALDEEYFISESNKLYQVILDNEHKHKKVFITEVGFTEYKRGQEVVGESIKRTYHAVATSMPYVETVNYFKLYDIATEAWSGSSGDNGMERYGLFYDFNPQRTYYELSIDDPTKHSDELCVSGAPKQYAYVFQKIAGGKGLLTLMQNYYKNKASKG